VRCDWKLPRNVTIAASPSESARVLLISGDIDVSESSAIRDAGLLLALRTGVVLDLGGVTFMDASGVSALLSIRMAALSAGTELVLRNVPSSVLRLLEVSDLRYSFAVEPTSDSR
jgi:anti-sigma B factor antagonist